MEGLVDFRHSTLACGRVPRSSILYSPKRSRRYFTARAKLVDQEEDDPFFQQAIERASLRWQETHRPDPLFIDPYVGSFVPSNIEVGSKPLHHPYCLATKFIDDKLLSTVDKFDGVKQVVLLTDGVDTRPYRLNWPRSTIIFDVSPERVFSTVTGKLEAVGAKVPRSCFFLHVPSGSSGIQHTLCSKGFNGARPSIWALQGLPIRTLASFKEILLLVGSLAMKDCLFLGELPACLVDSDVELKSNTKRWMEKIFLSNGFQVNMIQYDEIGKNLGRDLVAEDYRNILFVAEHLRFSDAQMDAWRREFQRIEEEGDEEGFEEL